MDYSNKVILYEKIHFLKRQFEFKKILALDLLFFFCFKKLKGEEDFICQDDVLLSSEFYTLGIPKNVLIQFVNL